MSKSSHSLHTQFLAFLQEHSLVRKGDRVALAVSGGLDSMVMTHLFRTLASAWDLQVCILHINHQLRGEESEEDERFVRRTAAALSLPIMVERVDVVGHKKETGNSTQESARDLRYKALESMRLRLGAAVTATAHHADDNAETVLMNAVRGAGVRGLSGIPLKRNHLVRPLLFATRHDLEAYASSAGIQFREDSSNSSLLYTRNVIRRTILPALGSSMEMNISASLNRVSEVMRSLQEKISSEVAARFPHLVRHDRGVLYLSLESMRKEPLYIQEEIILEIFRRLSIEPTLRKVQACLELCGRPIGRQLRLASQWSVLRDRQELVFGPPQSPPPFRHDLKIGGTYEFPGFRIAAQRVEFLPSFETHQSTLEYVDADRLGDRLVVRSWQDGDWFVPFGMTQRKKVSDFFVDTKISSMQKKITPILESNGAIVWICGLRLDQRFSVSGMTRSVARLEYSSTP